MWKKPTSDDISQPRTQPVSSPSPASSGPPSKPARIGSTLTVKGELFGEEDLFIEGNVQGKIVVKQHSVTVGERGRIEADINAASIRVAGMVKGNLNGTDQVILHETGSVEGDIKAKSVTLENGARFKGSIDMEGDGSPRGQRKDASSVGPSKSNGGTNAGLTSSRA